MTAATTLTAIRAELYNQVPGLGFTGVADSFPSSTKLRDTFMFKDATLTTNQYRSAYLFRPTLSGDDRVKRVTTLDRDNGDISVVSAWTDQATQPYELVGPMSPDELNACIQRALRRVYQETQLCLAGELQNADGDMETSGVTNWTSIGTPATKAKVSTAATVLSGTQALHVLNDAVNEGVQSASVSGFSTNGGELVFLSASVRADVGTAKLALYNVTASSEIASVTSAEEGFVHLWLEIQLPAGCEQIAARLMGNENNADLYWDHVALYRRNQLMLLAPSWLDEQYKFLKLREAVYMSSISSQTNGGYDDAASRYFKDWQQPLMYSLDPFHTETNPYRVQLMRPVPRNELWVDGKRPSSDFNTLAAETDVTYAPLNQVYAYAKHEIAKTLHKRYPGDQRWVVLLQEAEREVDAETSARPEIPLQPIRREYLGRI